MKLHTLNLRKIASRDAELFYLKVFLLKIQLFFKIKIKLKTGIKNLFPVTLRILSYTEQVK